MAEQNLQPAFTSLALIGNRQTDLVVATLAVAVISSRIAKGDAITEDEAAKVFHTLKPLIYRK